jgi:hypothetical protein
MADAADLGIFAGEALTRHGTLSRRTATWEEATETHTRASDGSYIERDGVLKSADTNVPRVEWIDTDADGTRDTPTLLLEGARTNDFTYSEQLDNAAWTKTRTSIGAIDTITAPDGYLTAEKLIEDSSPSTNHVLVRNTPAMTDDTDQAVSLYAKAGERTEIRVLLYDKAAVERHVWFDLSAGTVGTETSATGTIEDVGDGWYRCGIVANSNNGGNQPEVYTYLGSGSETVVYSGDGASGCYLWGYQFETDKPFVSSYISTDSYNLNGGGFLDLPGASGDYASAPDSAALSVTGDIDMRVAHTPPAWNPATNSTLISKYTAGDFSWLFEVRTNGTLRLVWSVDGSATISVFSTAALVASGGDILLFRATLDVDNGASGYDVAFYTKVTTSSTRSADINSHTGWTQLGTTVTGGSTTSIFDSAHIVEIGSYTTGTSGALTGPVQRAQIYNGIAGTLVFDADFTDISTHAATRTSVTEKANSAVVTVHSNSAATTRSADALYFDWPFAPQEMTVYCKFTERGTAQVNGLVVLEVGAAAGGDPRLFVETASAKYRLSHDIGATHVNVSAAAAPSIGDTVELRGVLTATGAVFMGQSINAAAEVVTATSGVAALQGSWAAPRLYIGAEGAGNTGFNAFHSIKVSRGTKTMAEMRLL